MEFKEKTNGWAEYKLLVLKELELLAVQISEITKSLSNVDKEQSISALKIEDITKTGITDAASLEKKLNSIEDLINNRILEDIKILRESKANLEGKASMTSVYIAYAISFITLIISLFHSRLHNHKIFLLINQDYRKLSRRYNKVR